MDDKFDAECARLCSRVCVFNSTLQEEPLIGGGLYEPEEGVQFPPGLRQFR